MKSKGSASLYEVLKSASRPSDPPGAAASEATPPPAAAEPGASPTLQERLAAYKAAKLSAVAPPQPAPAAPPSEEPPPPACASRDESGPVAGPKGPGERAFRLTYNTAVFAGLVGLGLLFISYAIGVQSGRKRAAEAVPSEAAAATPRAADPVPAPPPPAPPAPAVEFTIRAAEWRYGTAQERLKANTAADDLRKALDRANLKGAKKVVIQRAGEPRLALYLDSFVDPSAAAVKSRLASIQKLKVGTQFPFAQAQVEEAPK